MRPRAMLPGAMAWEKPWKSWENPWKTHGNVGHLQDILSGKMVKLREFP